MALRRIVTACRTFRIILTGLCSQSCGHCSYPSQYLDPLPSARKLRRLLRDAVQRKAVGVEFSSGQGIAQHQNVVEACRHYGLDSFLDYLEMAARCVEQMATARRSPLIPAWDLGPLSLAEMNRLRPILMSLRLSLESVDTSLRGKEVFRGAPAKAPRWSIQVINNAGRARIPVTITVLVGIGEQPGAVEKTLQTVAELHKAYGHVQAVCVRGFRPQPRTLMAAAPACDPKALIQAVTDARKILPEEVSVQVQAFETPDCAYELVRAGADDLGDFPLDGTPERWAEAEKLEKQMAETLARRGIGIRFRLPLHSVVLEKGLYPQTLEPRLLRAVAALKNGVSPEFAVREGEPARAWTQRVLGIALPPRPGVKPRAVAPATPQAARPKTSPEAR